MEELALVAECAVQAALAQAGRLGDVVHPGSCVAGRPELFPGGAHTEANVDLTLAVNVKGPLFTVQKALPLLAENASILVIGSSNSVRPNEQLEVYSASKAALSNLVHNWARQSRERRFRVNVLSPGPTRTPALLSAAGADADRFAEAVVPLGRLAAAEEIAEAALFLASDASSFVTGAELFADGGYTRA
ncbi:SDR family oxidoreductase [Streptomyces erythrochromogenes]|uniref:SDR family oxidoreductase n=1 Tax=Streptomyces erythrochromogenes TaxID=285574 RepID=UPI0033C07980